MSNSAAIAEAKSLLSRNQPDEARALLASASFTENLDPKAQQAFQEMFPPSDALEAELTDLLPKLGSKDSKSRRAAAHRVRREAMKEFTLKRKAWMADPRLTDALMRSLEAESDPAVQEEITGALAHTIIRYFPDLRAFPLLENLLSNRKKKTREYAVLGLGWLHADRRWALLAPLLKDPALEVRRAVCRVIAFKAQQAHVDQETKNTMLASLSPLMKDKDNLLQDLAGSAYAALQRTGGRKAT